MPDVISNVDFNVSLAAYQGDCATLRRQQDGESNWQAMMEYKTVIERDTFLGAVYHDGLAEMLDAYDYLDSCSVTLSTIEGAIATALDEWHQEDPSMAYCQSTWGSQVCYFIQQSGFEFIFTVE